MTDEPKDTEADVEDTAESAGADSVGSSASAEHPTAAESPPTETEAPAEPAKVEEPVAEAAESASADPVGSSASAEHPTGDETPEPPAEKSAAKAKAKAKPASTPAPTRRRQPKGDSDTVVRAQAKYVRTSARKARLVCDQIRGKEVEEAYAILAHTPRAVAEAWEKLLRSAVANAENNHELLEDDLRIVAAFADEGPTLKRFRPRAHGRATPIHKRTSHLTIQLNSKA